MITELVDLPDPAVRPLVHPLDLSEARGWFRASWALTVVGHPVVGLFAATSVWSLSGGYVVPWLVGAVVIGFGALASRYFAGAAWAFIPGKRQDRARVASIAYEVVAQVVFGAALASTLLLVVRRLEQPDVPGDVHAVTAGIAATVALVVFGRFVVDVVRSRRAWCRLPSVVAVIVGVLVFVV
ncbi:hypothetical protein [Actinokineospora inagensis]|uniref:hypothetical protein n=1 Tax=Actinokineospora inagensis TaxID=103730 RepID=UPI000427FEB0|nr:hypothetical protein [Actinokineospora inagensis]